MTHRPLAELPAWDRLAVPAGQQLEVEPLRHLTLDEPRGNITPRPPLVPVPASVLAAFALG